MYVYIYRTRLLFRTSNKKSLKIAPGVDILPESKQRTRRFSPCSLVVELKIGFLIPQAASLKERLWIPASVANVQNGSCQRKAHSIEEAGRSSWGGGREVGPHPAVLRGDTSRCSRGAIGGARDRTKVDTMQGQPP